jgi:hypothetical protein
LRRALFLIIVVLILIGSGFLTIQLSRSSGGALPGMRVQTENPEASVLVATSQKGTLFFLFTGFVLFNLVGIGVTLAVIFWFLNRSVNRAKVRPNSGFDFSLSPAKPNSLGGTLAAHPRITIGIVFVLVVGAALTMALLGLFSPR